MIAAGFEEGRMHTDQWVDDFLMLTLMGWSAMIVICYAALAIRLSPERRVSIASPAGPPFWARRAG
jgi:hypothetical protein